MYGDTIRPTGFNESSNDIENRVPCLSLSKALWRVQSNLEATDGYANLPLEFPTPCLILVYILVGL